MKKVRPSLCAAAALLLCALLLFPCALSEADPSVDPCGLRGWDLDAGYQYVVMGTYPYEEDGTEAPVLWQVLGVGEGKALLLTTYVIEVHQPIECGDRRIAEQKKYRAVTDYGETDLNVWLNDVMLDALLGDEPVLAAVTEEKYGRLYPLTDDDMLRDDYGFTHVRYYEQRSRWAYPTPYAASVKLWPEVRTYFNRLSVDTGFGTSSYWVARVKTPGKPCRFLQICANIAESGDPNGNNMGHLSYGFLTRTTVGLRLAVRLDTSRIQVASGSGTIWDPCRLAYVEDKAAEAPVAVTPAPWTGVTPVPTTPAPVKKRPRLESPPPGTTPVPVPDYLNP